LREAVAIGVGLDDGDVLESRGEGGADVLEVALERAEVDFGPATQGHTGVGSIHPGLKK